MSRPSIPWSTPGAASGAPHVRVAQAVPDLGLKLEITQARRLIDLTSRRHHRVFAIPAPAAWCHENTDPVSRCWERKQQDPIGLIDEQNPNRLTKPNVCPHDSHCMSTRRDGITSPRSTGAAAMMSRGSRDWSRRGTPRRPLDQQSRLRRLRDHPGLVVRRVCAAAQTRRCVIYDARWPATPSS
jgi:hypothetical protein